VFAAIEQGQVTGDVGGHLKTHQVTQNLIQHIQQIPV